VNRIWLSYHMILVELRRVLMIRVRLGDLWMMLFDDSDFLLFPGSSPERLGLRIWK
jgi:hypothetical protein